MPIESPATNDVSCSRCGRPIPEGANWCPSCGKLNASPRVRLIFCLILAIIFAGLGFTKWYVSYLKGLESSLAQRWFTRGEEAMAKNYPGAAVDEYRNALAYDGSNAQYRLKLAEALMAENRLLEARAYLLRLWSQAPADAQVNLDLARLYLRENKPDLAIRYYRTAIDGVWSNNALQRRIETRFELVNYFLQHGERSRATAELISLEAEAPDDPSIQLRIGDLLLQLNENRRAEKVFEDLLKEHPGTGQAWFGAGQAAMASGDYREAVRFLTTAVNLTSAKSESAEAQQLELARETADMDPNLRTLTMAERAQRVASAFNLAMQRLTNCAAKQGVTLSPEPPAKPESPGRGPTHASLLSSKQNGYVAPVVPPAGAPPSTLQLLYNRGMQRRSSAIAEALHKNPDTMAPTMEFVYETIRAMEAACPVQTLRERALQVLAHHEAEEQR